MTSSSSQGNSVNEIGIVVLKCLFSVRSVVDFKNFNFLFVPELIFSLLSLEKLRSEGNYLRDKRFSDEIV